MVFLWGTVNMVYVDVVKNTKTAHGNAGVDVLFSREQKQAFASAVIFPFGIISKFLSGNRVVQEQSGANGNNAVLGCLCENTEEISEGETMLYAKDGDGNCTAKIFLRANGEIEAVSIPSGSSVKLKDDGDIEANGANIKLSATGTVEITGSGGETFVIP
jgi:phage gp45-like